MIEPQRLAELNDAPERTGDYVLYWMQQSQRAAFNPALEVAIAAANRLGLPVLVGFGLTGSYPEANARHYAFMLEGLAETARDLQARGIAFVLRCGAPDVVAIRLARHAALVVCDRGYLRLQKKWRAHVAAEAKRRVLQVEGDVVVPVGLVSSKHESAARTLRPKLLQLRDDFLHPLRRERVRVPADRLGMRSDVEFSDIAALLAQLRIDPSVAPVSSFRGGYAEARRRLLVFVTRRLERYAGTRAQLSEAQVSTLSPYLHFGQISPIEIALAARKAEIGAEVRAAYLEQLVVRRELSMNFVNTVANYDRYECVPHWAWRTLEAHRGDRRQHLYGYDQLARAETHDQYWNAAMREMLSTGYMHNYMRMYWGKKVLEWSPSPEEGYATLLRLNDTYFLDGRDANSYANVGWVFGLHDRPWPERPIFGKVRYMNAAGLKRKTDIDAYVQRIDVLTGENTRDDRSAGIQAGC
ncbi:MAG TPA: deoxyribodipyrimidine photo-lyase [Acetobacteraceae bacterium]|nr:deoxyribodipyrimidine photo-lyase [Acetobacteraceae bacterium]